MADEQLTRRVQLDGDRQREQAVDHGSSSALKAIESNAPDRDVFEQGALRQLELDIGARSEPVERIAVSRRQARELGEHRRDLVVVDHESGERTRRLAGVDADAERGSLQHQVAKHLPAGGPGRLHVR